MSQFGVTFEFAFGLAQESRTLPIVKTQTTYNKVHTKWTKYRFYNTVYNEINDINLIDLFSK